MLHCGLTNEQSVTFELSLIKLFIGVIILLEKQWCCELYSPYVVCLSDDAGALKGDGVGTCILVW